MALNYQNYRVIRADVTINNGIMPAGIAASPALAVDIQPTIAPGNPTNLDVIQSDSSRYFCPTATSAGTCGWSMPGVGLSTNLWLDTSAVSSLGQFVIGSNPNFLVGLSGQNFDTKLDLLVQFSNPK